MNNTDKAQYMGETIYFYVDQPIRIMKIYEKVHMAEVLYVETRKSTIIDISAITKIPSKEQSISMGWFEGSRK